MKLEEFFLLDKKKILLSDSFAHAETLIKNYVLSFKKDVSNIEKETLINIASRLLMIHEPDMKVINDNAAIFIIDSLLRKNRYSFLDEQCFGLSTAQIFYESIKEIKNGYISQDKHNYPPYINILPLINDYQQYLNEHHLLDEPDVFNNAQKYVDSNTVAYGFDVVFGLTHNLINKLRYSELRFLNKLLNVYHQEQIIDVEYENDEQPQSLKVDAHGFINEVKYVVSDILNKHLNPFEVDIYVSDNSYENTLKSLLDYYDIPYHFDNGENMLSDPIIGAILDVLTFITELYDLKALFRLLENKAIKEEFIPLKKDITYLRCDNVNILAHAEKLKENNENFYQFFIKILNTTPPSLSINELYEAILDFIYYSFKEEYYSPLVDPLEQIKEELIFLDPISCPSNKDKAKIIQMYLSKIRINKTSPQCALNIKSLKQCFVIERKYNYLLGLSAHQMNIKEMQSPVLNDSDRQYLFSQGYYSLSQQNNENFQAQLFSFIRTAKENTHLIYIYSSYDSVEFKEQAPSIFYLNAGIEEITFDYQLDEGSPHLLANNSQKYKEVQFSFSPTSLKGFSDCPIHYLLANLEMYEDYQIEEFSNDWLKANDFGTFVHLILEKYFTENNTLEKQKYFDEISFNRCFEKAYQITLKRVPFSNKSAIESGKNKAYLTSKNYLLYFFNNRDGYFVTECEYKFSYENTVYQFTHGTETTAIKFKGTIDRIDVKIDDNGIFHLRLVDYKTSHYKTIDEMIKKGEAYQAFIYSLAGKQYVIEHLKELSTKLNKKINIEKIDDITNWDFEYVIFNQPDFQTERIIDIDEYNLIKAKIDQCLATLMKFNLSQEPINMVIDLNKKIYSSSEFNEGQCRFCSLSKHCPLKIALGENTII